VPYGNLHAISLDDDRVLLKRGVREVLVTGEDVEAVAAAVVDALAVGRGVADVLAALRADQRPTAVAVLEALAARRMLEDPGPGNGGDSAAGFYAEFGTAGRAAPQALHDAHVVLHGTGLVASALADALGLLGIGRLTAADETPVNDAAVVVAASDSGHEDWLLGVARDALAAGLPFLPVWVRDFVGFAGPLTWPYETACLRCYQLRVDANAPDAAVRRALRRSPAATGLLPPMASVIAQIAAMEVAKSIGGFAPVDVAGRSIEINVVSFRSAVRRVLKHPRCPDCGPGSRRPAQTVTSGVQIGE
jgi:bacteriocin biosynthesis cyclodehydratase domain-containing protein